VGSYLDGGFSLVGLRIRMSMEIGERRKGVLKNFGKVERFLLEQGRRMISEAESWNYNLSTHTCCVYRYAPNAIFTE
jgi:hypothetical protein